jgi:hypothetical protein
VSTVVKIVEMLVKGLMLPIKTHRQFWRVCVFAAGGRSDNRKIQVDKSTK